MGLFNGKSRKNGKGHFSCLVEALTFSLGKQLKSKMQFLTFTIVAYARGVN